MAPGEAPKQDLSADEQAAITRINELKGKADKVKDEIDKAPNEEAKALKIAEAKSLTAQLQEATKTLQEATAAKMKKLSEAKEAELKAAPKPAEVAPQAPVAPTTAPAATPAAAPTTAATAVPATASDKPATAEQDKTEKPAETEDGTIKMFKKLFTSDKVVGWLSDHPALRQIAEVFATLFGVQIDWAKKEGEKLAGDSQAALNQEDLNKLSTLTKETKLPETTDTNDPKDEDSPWKHVGQWLGLGAKVGNMADYYSIVSKGKNKVDLGPDKGGVQDVPNFTSMKEVGSTGYKAGDVVIYKDKTGERIPVVVIDASDRSTPIVSFINRNGIKPVGKSFDEIKSLQYAIKGSLSDPSVQEGLSGFSVDSIYRQATIEDQQKWYAENHPEAKKAAGTPATAPAATVATPAAAPSASPTTAAPQPSSQPTATAPSTQPSTPTTVQPTVAPAGQPTNNPKVAISPVPHPAVSPVPNPAPQVAISPVPNPAVSPVPNPAVTTSEIG